MTIRRFAARRLAQPAVPLSHGVLAGGWLHVSGMVARTATGEINTSGARPATRQCLENMEAVLQEVGADRSHAVKVQVYLVDFGDYAEMNAAFQEFFYDGLPARTTIQAGGLGLGLVELDAVAYVGDV